MIKVSHRCMSILLFIALFGGGFAPTISAMRKTSQNQTRAIMPIDTRSLNTKVNALTTKIRSYYKKIVTKTEETAFALVYPLVVILVTSLLAQDESEENAMYLQAIIFDVLMTIMQRLFTNQGELLDEDVLALPSVKRTQKKRPHKNFHIDTRMYRSYIRKLVARIKNASNAVKNKFLSAGVTLFVFCVPVVYAKCKRAYSMDCLPVSDKPPLCWVKISAYKVVDGVAVPYAPGNVGPVMLPYTQEKCLTFSSSCNAGMLHLDGQPYPDLNVPSSYLDQIELLIAEVPLLLNDTFFKSIEDFILTNNHTHPHNNTQSLNSSSPRTWFGIGFGTGLGTGVVICILTGGSLCSLYQYYKYRKIKKQEWLNNQTVEPVRRRSDSERSSFDTDSSSSTETSNKDTSSQSSNSIDVSTGYETVS